MTKGKFSTFLISSTQFSDMLWGGSRGMEWLEKISSRSVGKLSFWPICQKHILKNLFYKNFKNFNFFFLHHMDLGESNYHAKNFWPGSTHLWENAIFQNSRFTHFMGTATSNGCHAHTVRRNQKFFSPIYQPRWVLQNGQQKNFWVADTHSSPYWPVVIRARAAG